MWIIGSLNMDLVEPLTSSGEWWITGWIPHSVALAISEYLLCKGITWRCHNITWPCWIIHDYSVFSAMVVQACSVQQWTYQDEIILFISPTDLTCVFQFQSTDNQIWTSWWSPQAFLKSCPNFQFPRVVQDSGLSSCLFVLGFIMSLAIHSFFHPDISYSQSFIILQADVTDRYVL